MKEERRLVWRVLRRWKEIAESGRFPLRDEVDRCLQGEDGANCLLIAVESPIELSHFVAVGVNLAVALSLRRHFGRFALVAVAAGGVGTPWSDD
jgi:hypothetical protein